MEQKELSIKYIAIADGFEHTEKATRLTGQFHLESISYQPKGDYTENCLQLDENGLTLIAEGNTLRGDFTKLLPRITRGHLQHELLLRAIKRKNAEGAQFIVDATAGMGEDSFIMAAGGNRLLMMEHNPLIALLLQDALERAKEIPELAEVVERMTLVQGDSLELLKSLSEHPDIVYLDPMFPPRKKERTVRKKPQVLQMLEPPCQQEQELLDAAMEAQPERIVIKRPPDGEFLAGRKPSHSLERKGVRFDCIAL